MAENMGLKGVNLHLETSPTKWNPPPPSFLLLLLLLSTAPAYPCTVSAPARAAALIHLPQTRFTATTASTPACGSSRRCPVVCGSPYCCRAFGVLLP